MSTPVRPTAPAYSKPWCSYADQVALIESRGIVVGNREAAKLFLSHVNYYRLSGYFLAFENTRHAYPEGVTFEQVVSAYEFDRDLRDLVTEALEVVEVDFRAAIAYHFGQKYGAFGHCDQANFFRSFNHGEWSRKVNEEADRSSELFVTHFRRKYDGFPDLPVWIVTEVMSFGCLSRMLKGMHKSDQKEVAKRYGLQPDVLQGWMHHCVYVRNLCAHHSRIWDRVWAIKPTLPFSTSWKTPYVTGNDRLHAHLLILRSLMKRCPTMREFANNWRLRIEHRLNDPPAVQSPEAEMGLPALWRKNPNWM